MFVSIYLLPVSCALIAAFLWATSFDVASETRDYRLLGTLAAAAVGALSCLSPDHSARIDIPALCLVLSIASSFDCAIRTVPDSVWVVAIAFWFSLCSLALIPLARLESVMGLAICLLMLERLCLIRTGACFGGADVAAVVLSSVFLAPDTLLCALLLSCVLMLLSLRGRICGKVPYIAFLLCGVALTTVF